MTTRACPDWPDLMELAPDLHFKHFTVAEAQLPGEVLMQIPQTRLGEIEICCDPEQHVFNPKHTDPHVSEALRCSHWYDVQEWATTGPGAAFSA
jgi:hypothetical protein